STGGHFPSDQILAGNEARLQSARRVNDPLHPALPGGIKLNARYRGEKVNGHRLTAHAKERAWLGEVGGGQTFERRSELRQGREKRLGVSRVRLHQNIEVLGCPGLRVNGDGVSSHDKILNAVRVQNGQEFFEVWIHREARPSSHSVPG